MQREIGKALADLESALIAAGVPEEKARASVDEIENQVGELLEEAEEED